MINLIKYVLSIIYKKKINVDKDFWGVIYNTDLDNEEVDNNVRYSFAIYEPIS